MSRAMRMAVLAATVLILLLAGCGRWSPWVAVAPGQVAAAVRHQNLGLAHLEEGQLALAEHEFRAMTQVAPYVAAGYANLAVAMLPEPGKRAQALAAARTAVALAPRDAAVRQVLAQLLAPTDESVRRAKPAGRRDDFAGALEQLEAAVTAEPNNARPLYQLAELYQLCARGDPFTPQRGQVLQQLVRRHPDNLTAQLLWANFAVNTGRLPEARAALDQAILLADPLPRLGDDLLAKAHSALRAGDTVSAADAMEVLTNLLRPTWRQVADRRVLECPIGDQARFAVRDFSAPPPPAAPSAHADVRFEDVTAAMGFPPASARKLAVRGGALAVAPMTEDARLAIYVVSPAGTGRLYLGGRTGFVDATSRSGLAAACGTVAAFIDADNDGRLDLYLAGAGPDRIFRGLGAGRFIPWPVQGLSAGRSGSGNGASPGAPPILGNVWGDFDQDGDLDLLRLEQGPGSAAAAWLFWNNRDGSFTGKVWLAGRHALLAQRSGSHLARNSLLWADCDGDGDLDVFFGDPYGRGARCDNRGGGCFVQAGMGSGGGSSVRRAPVVTRAGAASGDDPAGLVLRLEMGAIGLVGSGSPGEFVADHALPAFLAGFAPRDAAVLDCDNDGVPDLVVAGRPADDRAGGLRLLRGEAGGGFTDVTPALPSAPAMCAVVPADLDGDGATDLVALRQDGGIALLHNVGGARNHWLDVVLQGCRQSSFGNNSFGLGATIEVMRGRYHGKQTVRGPVTHFGLGPAGGAVDVVRIAWPNGKRQTLVGSYVPRLDTLRREAEYVAW